MAAGYMFEGNRKQRRRLKAQDRQAEKLSRRPVMPNSYTPKHPQQGYKQHPETLRDSLNEEQIDILAQGCILLHRICKGPAAYSILLKQRGIMQIKPLI